MLYNYDTITFASPKLSTPRRVPVVVMLFPFSLGHPEGSNDSHDSTRNSKHDTKT
jgi:hypothetical protein